MRDDGQSLSDGKRCYSSLSWKMWYENSRSMYLLRKDNIDFAFVSTAPTHILHSLLKTPSGSIYFKCLCFVRRREVYRWLSFFYKTIYFHSASVKQELKLLLGNITTTWQNAEMAASQKLVYTFIPWVPEGIFFWSIFLNEVQSAEARRKK